jgi:putative ABC transport system ATP-binding protein
VTALLAVRDLWKSFSGPDGALPVLRGVDLDLSAGRTLALTGESGSGKSTLLHLIGGLDRPDSGSILLDGTEVTRLDDRGRARLRRDAVGVVFQQFNLVPSLNAADNIAFQARLKGARDASWDEELARRLGLTPHLAKFPRSFRAASSSAWPSPAPSPPARASSSPTSPRATSTRTRPAPSST